MNLFTEYIAYLPNCVSCSQLCAPAGLEAFARTRRTLHPADMDEEEQWFVMRDLKRANAKSPAYKALPELGFTVFTPMKLQVADRGGRRTRQHVPFIPDLLFVQSTRSALDTVVDKTPTLQYRYVKGAPYCTPMVVPAGEMQRFITAVGLTDTPRYYTLDELTPAMVGARVRISSDGPLNTFEGHLLRIRGSHKRRILIKLEGLLAAAIELAPPATLELL